MASDRPKRKAIPLRVKLDAALIALGLDPKAVQFDHSPPIALRQVNAAGDDYVPNQLDPRHIVPMSTAAHRTKTSGTPPGQKVVHVADGDQHKIAKADRLERARRLMEADNAAALEMYRADPLAPVRTSPGVPRSAWPKGRKMQSRPFPKKARPSDG